MSNEIFCHVKRKNFDNKLRVTVYFKSHKDFVNSISKHGGIFSRTEINTYGVAQLLNNKDQTHRFVPHIA